MRNLVLAPVEWFLSRELPPERVLVLVWVIDDAHGVAGFDLAHRYNGLWYLGAVEDGFAPEPQASERITHWQPLPAPPSEKVTQILS
jgi:hypothetical protein